MTTDSVREIDELAQFIRQIDGAHTMGAGALAERIVEWQASRERYVPRWIPVSEMETDSYEGWCWIVYKGRVTEAYRDHEYSYRFAKYSQNVYMTECISWVMPWEYPATPNGGNES